MLFSLKTDWKVGEEMKRIGTRIVLAVLFCSIIMSLLLGGFSTIRIISVIRKESKENLLQLTRVYGKTLDELLVSIERNNIPIAVVGIDIRVDDIVNTIKEIVAFRSGYAFMLNKDYDYVIHPTLDRNSNLRTIKDGEVDYIAEELDSKEYGILDAKYDGEKRL